MTSLAKTLQQSTVLIDIGKQAITYPDDREGIFDKEVEDKGDQAYEGQDCNANHFFLICGIQFVLCDAPKADNENFMAEIKEFGFSLNVISEFSECIPQLHHVVSDGVEVLESTADVTRAFVEIQSIVKDDLVTETSDIIVDISLRYSTKKRVMKPGSSS